MLGISDGLLGSDSAGVPPSFAVGTPNRLRRTQTDYLGLGNLTGGVGCERVTRAYTVEVQTASVFYAQSLILLLFEP